jgi:hypothetical protein
MPLPPALFAGRSRRHKDPAEGRLAAFAQSDDMRQAIATRSERRFRRISPPSMLGMSEQTARLRMRLAEAGGIHDPGVMAEHLRLLRRPAKTPPLRGYVQLKAKLSLPLDEEETTGDGPVGEAMILGLGIGDGVQADTGIINLV